MTLIDQADKKVPLSHSVKFETLLSQVKPTAENEILLYLNSLPFRFDIMYNKIHIKKDC